MARQHDAHLRHAGDLSTPGHNHRLRHAIEVRHDSFRNPDFIALLRRHRVALVVSDAPTRWPRLRDVTAGFLYLRLHSRESWLFSIVFTVAVWAAFYGLFDLLLHLAFPAGWLFSAFTSA